AYGRLYELGWAHSVEGWDDEGLAGGLYCLAIGGLVAGESMFHRRPGGSKAAFLALVELVRAAGDCERRLFDVQWATPNLERLGAVGISRAEYVAKLERALALTDPFGSTLSGPLRVRQIADPGSGTSA
ncbi:MAG: leucyl/phenylalanyl-tRNA--protein transferase, partial [Gaiella sp.]